MHLRALHHKKGERMSHWENVELTARKAWLVSFALEAYADDLSKNQHTGPAAESAKATIAEARALASTISDIAVRCDQRDQRDARIKGARV